MSIWWNLLKNCFSVKFCISLLKNCFSVKFCVRQTWIKPMLFTIWWSLPFCLQIILLHLIMLFSRIVAIEIWFVRDVRSLTNDTLGLNCYYMSSVLLCQWSKSRNLRLLCWHLCVVLRSSKLHMLMICSRCEGRCIKNILEIEQFVYKQKSFHVLLLTFRTRTKIQA